MTRSLCFWLLVGCGSSSLPSTDLPTDSPSVVRVDEGSHAELARVLTRHVAVEVSVREASTIEVGDQVSHYVLYEYDTAELCAHPGGAHTPECARAVRTHPDTDEELPCQSYFIAIVRDGQIVTESALGSECRLQDVARFALTDVDHDERLELSFALHKVEYDWNTNGSDAVEQHLHINELRIYDAALRPQLAELRSVRGGGQESRTLSSALRDVDGDGHDDLVIQESFGSLDFGEHVEFYDPSRDRWGWAGDRDSGEQQLINAALQTYWDGPALLLASSTLDTQVFVLYAVDPDRACQSDESACLERAAVFDDSPGRGVGVYDMQSRRWAANVALDGELDLHTVLRFGVRDLDWDGRPELLVDVVSVESHTELASYGTTMNTVDVFDVLLHRRMSVVSNAVSNPVDLLPPTEMVGRRLRFRVGGDHAPEPVVQEVRYLQSEDGCATELDGMLRTNQQEEDLELGQCVGVTTEHVLPWAP